MSSAKSWTEIIWKFKVVSQFPIWFPMPWIIILCFLIFINMCIWNLYSSGVNFYQLSSKCCSVLWNLHMYVHCGFIIYKASTMRKPHRIQNNNHIKTWYKLYKSFFLCCFTNSNVTSFFCPFLQFQIRRHFALRPWLIRVSLFFVFDFVGLCNVSSCFL